MCPSHSINPRLKRRGLAIIVGIIIVVRMGPEGESWGTQVGSPKSGVFVVWSF